MNTDLKEFGHTHAVFPLREMLDNFRNKRSKHDVAMYYLEGRGNKQLANLLGTNAEPCTINMMQQEEADSESEEECKNTLDRIFPTKSCPGK